MGSIGWNSGSDNLVQKWVPDIRIPNIRFSHPCPVCSRRARGRNVTAPRQFISAAQEYLEEQPELVEGLVVSGYHQSKHHFLLVGPGSNQTKHDLIEKLRDPPPAEHKTGFRRPRCATLLSCRWETKKINTFGPRKLCRLPAVFLSHLLDNPQASGLELQFAILVSLLEQGG